MKRLELHLFGSFQATLDGEPLTGFRSDKVRALLAYLALEGERPHRRQALAALLWGEQPDESAQASLRVALHNLRQMLKPLLVAGDEVAEGGVAEGEVPDTPPLLTITRQSVQFSPQHPACWVDAVEFDSQIAAQQAHLHRNLVHCDTCVQRMERVVELYRGDFLAGLALADSPAFDEWQTLQQEARHHQASGALRALTTHYMALAEYGAVEHYARRQIELDSWDEEGHRALMWGLAMGGRRAAALAQYESCRCCLQQELGAEPAEATSDLYRQILDGALGWDAEADAAAEPQNPYKGLQPFEEADAGRFFGRELLVDRLLARLREGEEGPREREAGDAGAQAGAPDWQNRFLAVVGPSGSGKSSLVRAGLIPALRRAGALGGQRWTVASLFPGEDPEAGLAAALEAALPSGPRTETTEQEGPVSVQHFVEEHLPPGRRLLLFVDQAEELFTLTRDEATRTGFAAGLLAAMQTLPERLWIVVALRADYYDRPLRFPNWSRLFHERLEIAPPLTPEELERAIVGPAARVGVTLETGLVTRLVADVGDEPGSLPLLQYALTELFERREGRTLTLAAYRAIGALAGALVGRAEALYAGLSAGEQVAARQLFLRLVVPQDASQQRPADARRRVPQSELESLGDEPGAMAAVMAAFGRHRLLTFDRDATMEQPTVEVAHEVLLGAWPRLRAWLEESRADIRLHRRLATLAEEWDRAGRDAGFLARGPRLAQFETLLTSPTLALAPVESDYLRASLAERDRRRAEEEARLVREAAIERRARNRLRGFVAVLSVAVVVALGLVAFALGQQRIARREAAVAYSLNLATGAQLALNEGDTDLALALALQANQIPDPPPQAQLILSQAAYAPSARLVLTGHTGAVESVAFHPADGRTALSGSADGSLILWDLETGDAIRRLTGHSDVVHSVAFLPDGERAISASGDGSLIVWDLASGEIVQRLTGHTGAVWDVAVHPDGRHVLSASADNTLRLWDISTPLNAGLETGQTIQQFVGHEGAVYCVDISSDGRRALSGSADHSVIWWDIATGNIVHHFGGQSNTYTHQDLALYTPQLVGHQGPVWDVAISPAGRIAMSVSEDQYAILWDLETGELVREYQILRSGLFSAGFIPDGRLAVLGTLDGRVVLLTPYYGQTEREFLGHQGRVLALDLSPDGQSILSGSADGSLRLWDLSNGAELRQLHFPDSGASLDLSSDGKLGLVAHWSGDINVWDYTSGQTIRRLVGHTEMPYAGVKFGPDGRLAISGSGDIFGVAQDKTLRVWDVETGQELHRFEGYADILWDIDLSPDGRWAVSASRDGAVQLWDIPSSLETGTNQGRVLINLAPQAARSVAVSSDGRSVLVGPGKGASAAPDYRLRLLELETGADLAPPSAFSGHTETVQAVAFSLDGRMALSSGLDKLVILWDVASGREIRRFVGHTAEVTQVAFSPGCDPAQSGTAGRCMVLSAGGDSVIILWDMESGEALRRYQGHQGNILGAVFMPGGRTILSAAVDSTVREWRVDLGYDDLLAWIEANRYVPELTCQQRAQYHVEPLCEASDLTNP
ncbi:MAG: hypothetical protein JXM73_14010 [Anaerolineae bacterium]|nr:hypothetical protein [Anaerolineae bacterium]